MLGQRKWLSGTLMDVKQTWLSVMPPLMLMDFMIWTSLFSLQSQLILAVVNGLHDMDKFVQSSVPAYIGSCFMVDSSTGIHTCGSSPGDHPPEVHLPTARSVQYF